MKLKSFLSQRVESKMKSPPELTALPDTSMVSTYAGFDSMALNEADEATYETLQNRLHNAFGTVCDMESDLSRSKRKLKRAESDIRAFETSMTSKWVEARATGPVEKSMLEILNIY